ncbi:MAG: hypothetical protein ACI97K_000347 [Glaciecola sp.]|jgi:hypothetical protein
MAFFETCYPQTSKPLHPKSPKAQKPKKAGKTLTNPCNRKCQSAGRRLPSDPWMGLKRLSITWVCESLAGIQQALLADHMDGLEAPFYCMGL